ncbi:cysteine desulfurase family protein [Alkalicoccus daliensis]|uniref:Cysteine desulfurase n=1 Tax=Alkalicoccus daliensis TaxID=745820 RepID=A0A1H0CAN6_9BACI|nr:cysteine desulfurase family protein [Alkalicoccus daliensis]SDN54950.1 cysteine desulfurase [Alkalicoccus daliensis]
MIYLDNSATTKPWKSVLETYTQVSEKYFANPSSLHPLGAEAERLLMQARKQTAELLKVAPEEVIFTSGATEGNNIAIQGAVNANKGRGRHIITTAIEHPSVLRTMNHLEERGFEVTYLFPDKEGRVKASQVAEKVRKDTILVSVMHVNNETGSIQPIKEIGKVLTNHSKVLFHVDNVQGIGKVPLNIKNAGIDLLTISGHKFHGVKGSGVLFAKRNINLVPLYFGGTQERALRAGTESTAGAAALAKALRMTLDREPENRNMKNRLEKLASELSKYNEIIINSPVLRAPHILNFSVIGRKPESIVSALAEKNIYVSTTSACSSKDSEESIVLKAMGLPEERTTSSLRISLSLDTTDKEISDFLKSWKEIYYEVLKVGG